MTAYVGVVEDDKLHDKQNDTCHDNANGTENKTPFAEKSQSQISVTQRQQRGGNAESGADDIHNAHRLRMPCAILRMNANAVSINGKPNTATGVNNASNEFIFILP